MPSDADIEPSTLAAWVELLDEFLEAVTRRTDGGWSPVVMSQAEREIRETARLPRVDGSGDTWGRNPASTVYAVAEVLTQATIDHVRSLRTLIAAGPPAPTSVDALARGALEAASTIWWLTDDGIAARTRVARLYTVRRKSAVEFERAANAMQLPPHGGYGKTAADLDSYYQDTLGLTDRPLLPTYTQKVNDYLKAMGHPTTTAVYNFLSASAHAQLWRLEYGYVNMPDADGTERLYQYYPQSFLRVGIGVAAESLAHAIRLSFQLLGREASLHDVWRCALPINRAFAID